MIITREIISRLDTILYYSQISSYLELARFTSRDALSACKILSRDDKNRELENGNEYGDTIVRLVMRYVTFRTKTSFKNIP